MKLDEMLSFSKKNKMMTSLLGHMFTKGIDKDHSHGIGFSPAAESSDESESESEHEQPASPQEADESIGSCDEPDATTVNDCVDAGSGIMRDSYGIGLEPEANSTEETCIHSSHGISQLHKGPLIDDSSSIDSGATKKKFMAVYRDDSDDESVISKGQDAESSLDVSEHNSLDCEDGDDGSDVVGHVTADIMEVASDVPRSPACEQALDISANAACTQSDKAIETHLLGPRVSEGEAVPVVNQKTESQPDDNESDSDDDDDAEINEELAAKIRGGTLANALEEIVTGEEVPVVLEEEVKEEESDEESEPGDVWDYATVLEGQDYSPYRCLVCVPKSLQKSINVCFCFFGRIEIALLTCCHFYL